MLCHHSKFLARNIPLERLLKDFKEDHHPSSSNPDCDRDSCDMAADQLGSADLDDDHTQHCGDSAFSQLIKLEVDVAAAATGLAAVLPPAPADGSCEGARMSGCSPASSTHSEQCGVHNSVAPNTLNTGLAYQVRAYSTHSMHHNPPATTLCCAMIQFNGPAVGSKLVYVVLYAVLCLWRVVSHTADTGLRCCLPAG